jgi:hypothetical protein
MANVMGPGSKRPPIVGGLLLTQKFFFLTLLSHYREFSMKIILLVYALFGLVLIIHYLRFRNRYGTRAQRKALEDQLLKDLAYLRSDPFTRSKRNKTKHRHKDT